MAEVEDRMAITDRVTELLDALDARDWPGVRGCLADRVKVDYTSLFGGTPSEMSGDALVDQWKGLVPGFDRTQHLTGPLRTLVSGGWAHSRCAVTATHVLGARRWVVGGHYDIDLVRGDGGWSIVGIRLDAAFIEGDRSLPRAARQRLAPAHRPDPPPWA